MNFLIAGSSTSGSLLPDLNFIGVYSASRRDYGVLTLPA